MKSSGLEGLTELCLVHSCNRINIACCKACWLEEQSKREESYLMNEFYHYHLYDSSLQSSGLLEKLRKGNTIAQDVTERW